MSPNAVFSDALLDCLDNPGALSGMLREESEAKPDRPKRIGFGG